MRRSTASTAVAKSKRNQATTTPRPTPLPIELEVAQDFPVPAERIVYQETNTRLSHQGPIPAPEDLAAYEKLYPGSAERIIAMAERQQAHRFDLEVRQVDARIEDLRENRRERRRGQNYALVIGLAGLATTGLAAYFEQQWVAGILGGATLVALVSVFLYDATAAKQAPPTEPTSPTQPQLPAEKKPGDFAKEETTTEA